MNLPLTNFTKLFSVFNSLLELSDKEIDMHCFERLSVICTNLREVLKKDGLDITSVLSSITKNEKSKIKLNKNIKHHQNLTTHKGVSTKIPKGVFKQVYNDGNCFEYVDLDGNKFYVL